MTNTRAVLSNSFTSRFHVFRIGQQGTKKSQLPFNMIPCLLEPVGLAVRAEHWNTREWGLLLALLLTLRLVLAMTVPYQGLSFLEWRDRIMTLTFKKNFEPTCSKVPKSVRVRFLLLLIWLLKLVEKLPLTLIKISPTGSQAPSEGQSIPKFSC